MSKSSCKYCEGTIGIQNTYQFDEVASKFVSRKHVYEPVANIVLTLDQGIMVQTMKQEYTINKSI